MCIFPRECIQRPDSGLRLNSNNSEMFILSFDYQPTWKVTHEELPPWREIEILGGIYFVILQVQTKRDESLPIEIL